INRRQNTNSVWSTYPQMRSILRSVLSWSNFNRNGWSILNRYQHSDRSLLSIRRPLRRLIPDFAAEISRVCPV
ncbi:MAG: hypothetical protein KDF62_09880, partial [Nitrosomonas sp.]|nr:hypothetical protein [Nitrosomonas sp.]